MVSKINFFVLILLLIPNLVSEQRGITGLEQQADYNLQIGKQYLLCIGIDRYEKWLPLRYPVQDAGEIRNILVKRYHIDEVIELYNEKATKANIIKTFRELQEKLEIQDSLLIYYAGHGYLDKTSNTGFWIPVNAGINKDEQIHWLPNHQIRGIISQLRASHICLISDSCFSGDILNSVRGTALDTPSTPYLRESYKLTSRQVITSGSSESVPDQSEFSLQLKMALQKNNESFIDPLMLYNQIRLGVKDTLPLLGSLKDTGHQEGASFLLFLKDKASAELVTLTILCKNSGKLLVNGEYYVDLKKDENHSLRLTPAPYTITMLYPDEKNESLSIQLEKEKSGTLIFSYDPEQILHNTTGKKQDPSTLLIGLTADLFTVLPLGAMSEILQTNFGARLSCMFSFPAGLWSSGLGFTAGAVLNRYKEDASSAFFYMFPVGISGKITLRFLPEIYMQLDADAGFAASLWTESQTLNSGYTLRPYSSSNFSLGFVPIKWISISAIAGYTMVFFDKYPYQYLSIGGQLQIRF